jgi:DNA-binding transcriptional MerR regulator
MQRKEVREKMNELWEDGATHEEIRQEVKSLLKGYGVNVPDDAQLLRGHRLGRQDYMGKLDSALTRQQRITVRRRLSELQEAGVKKSYMHGEIAELLKSYGVEPPNIDVDMIRMRGGHFGPGLPPGLGTRLTEEQSEELQDKIDTMRNEGANRQEIREMVKKVVDGYGIDLPDKGRGHLGHGKRYGASGFMSDLTPEQRAVVHQKTKSMRQVGASSEEIHAAVKEILTSYGVELPADFGQYRQIWHSLSDEQRQEIHQLQKSMHDEGTSREEIREAVRQLLQEYSGQSDNEQSQQGEAVEPANKNLLLSNFPNPFNPETSIQFELKSARQIRLDIFDIQGKQVKSLVNEYRQAGTYTVRWDGHDENGIPVPSGVYFLRMNAGDESVSRKIVMTK